MCADKYSHRYVQPGSQGTSGDEAVAWRACHQQHIEEHSLSEVEVMISMARVLPTSD